MIASAPEEGKILGPWGPRIRTIGFLIAFFPVAVLVFILGILALIPMSPFMIYAKVLGKHLKDPRSA